MATVAQIRSGLKDRLATIATAEPAFIAYDVPASQTVPPCGIVMHVEPEPDQTFGSGALTRYDVDVLVLVPQAGDQADAQRKLDSYISSSGGLSVERAIASDRTLGGVAHSTFVLGWRRRQTDEANSAGYLSQRLNLRVWAS